MRMMIAAMLVLSSMAQRGGALVPDPPVVCDPCEGWNREREPFRVFGDTYYVVTAGLSSVLIASEQGLILLDGALPQSAAQIDRNIRKLGFRTENIRLIVNSHAHFDHAGGIAALQRFSGAEVVATASGAEALRQGQATKDDPQYGFVDTDAFTQVPKVRVIKDGEKLRVGPLQITARFTPGHTPGGTTWMWRSCERGRCVDVVYADSLTAVSAPGFRFTGDATHPSIVDRFSQSIKTIDQLPCDILIPVHPGFSNLFANADKANPDAFIEPRPCRVYATMARRTLDQRIAQEKQP